MLQGILDKVDAWINKTRSPIMNVVILTPLFIIVSLPIAMIGAALATIAVGTTPSVGQDTATPAIVAGVAVIVLFWAWAAYGTYSHSKNPRA